MYGRATQTSITVVSKFPPKSWGAVHAQTVDTRRPYPIFFQVPGNKVSNLIITVCCVVQVNGRLKVKQGKVIPAVSYEDWVVNSDRHNICYAHGYILYHSPKLLATTLVCSL